MSYRDVATGKYARGGKRMMKLALIMTVLFFVWVIFHQLFISWLDKQHAEMSFVKEANAEEVTPQILARQMMGQSIESLKMGLVRDIEKCESGGDYGIIIFDSNNEASVGGLQFQRKTIIHYEKKFYSKEIGKAEAIAIAIKKEAAQALAEEIIFNEEDGWKNWFNCGVKVNAAARVAAINSL